MKQGQYNSYRVTYEQLKQFFTTKQNMNKTQLKNLLESNYISTSQWGKGRAKTLDHLLREIGAGETILKTEDDGILKRHTSILTINVLFVDHEDGRTVYRLEEFKQVFSDGRERKRNESWSIAEKLKLGETDMDLAVQRALQEELGVNSTGFMQWPVIETRFEETVSPSYPGLRAKFTIHSLKVFLDKSQFKPEGYTEIQEDKTTYFKWSKVK